MDCHFNNTLDLCSEPECLDSVITSKHLSGLEAPHTPKHSILKVHHVLFSRDAARTERNAKAALEVAWNMISDLEANKAMPGCDCCRNMVSLPCWYCVDCTGEFLQNPFILPRSNEFFM